MLETLMRAPGRVFTREQLIRNDEALDRTVDAPIENLRRKIEDDRAHPTRIVTADAYVYRLPESAKPREIERFAALDRRLLITFSAATLAAMLLTMPRLRAAMWDTNRQPTTRVLSL